ncbi:Large structural protein [Bienertia sinuspersici]
MGWGRRVCWDRVGVGLEEGLGQGGGGLGRRVGAGWGWAWKTGCDRGVGELGRRVATGWGWDGNSVDGLGRKYLQMDHSLFPSIKMAYTP